MRVSCFATLLVLFVSLGSAWPWPAWTAQAEDRLERRDESSSTAAAVQTSTANSQSSSTGSVSGSGSPASKTTQSPSSSSDSSPTKSNTTSSISVAPNLPAGGISMLTPAVQAPASYYKVGNNVTFAWNYTSLVVTPTAIDVLVTCTANAATYSLANNMSVESTGQVVWDTGNSQNFQADPLLTEHYTLVVYDAGGSVTRLSSPGYLAVQNSYQFAMYTPQSYTANGDGYVCVTCNGALSTAERQTLSFVFGMVGITVLSFTWFANGMLSL